MIKKIIIFIIILNKKNINPGDKTETERFKKLQNLLKKTAESLGNLIFPIENDDYFYRQKLIVQLIMLSIFKKNEKNKNTLEIENFKDKMKDEIKNLYDYWGKNKIEELFLPKKMKAVWNLIFPNIYMFKMLEEKEFEINLKNLVNSLTIDIKYHNKKNPNNKINNTSDLYEKSLKKFLDKEQVDSKSKPKNKKDEKIIALLKTYTEIVSVLFFKKYDTEFEYHLEEKIGIFQSFWCKNRYSELFIEHKNLFCLLLGYNESSFSCISPELLKTTLINAVDSLANNIETYNKDNPDNQIKEPSELHKILYKNYINAFIKIAKKEKE